MPLVESEWQRRARHLPRLPRQFDIDVSRSTVYRDVEAKGLYAKMLPKCPWMDDQEKKDARKEFCEREDINALAARLTTDDACASATMLTMSLSLALNSLQLATLISERIAAGGRNAKVLPTDPCKRP